MASLAGKFLLASKSLLDANFARAAVFVVRHDNDGAFGLIVNRPMPVTISTALGDTIDAAVTIDAPVFSGGPCEGPVFVLHTDPAIGGDSPLAGVFVTTDRDAIEALLIAQAGDYKVFGSYSGWSPGQIEAEIEEGSWVISDATAAQIFSTASNVWSLLSSRAHLSKYVRPDQIPDDPSVN